MFLIVEGISDRDDMINLNYHDIRYHDNYWLTVCGDKYLGLSQPEPTKLI